MAYGRTRGASPIKLILVGVVVLALLGGGAFFGLKFLRKGSAPKEEAAKTAVAEGEKPKEAGPHDATAEEEAEDAALEGKGGGGEGEGAAGPPLLVLKQIVNLEGPRRNAFLKCELHIVFRDPELGRLAAGDKATVENSTIRAMVLEMLSGKTLEEARDLEFRESLRKEMKERLNTRFAAKPKEKEDKAKKAFKYPIKDILVVDWGIQE